GPLACTTKAPIPSTGRGLLCGRRFDRTKGRAAFQRGTRGRPSSSADGAAFSHPTQETSMSENRFARCILRPAAAALLLAVALLACAPSSGQGVKGAGKGKQPDFIPAGYDDYQHMLDRLGIKTMRRGRDGRGKDTSSEATANPYKETMPDLMTLKDGTKVTS